MKTFQITPRAGGASRPVSIIGKSQADLSVFNQTSAEAKFAEVAAFFSAPTAFSDRLILSRALVQSPYAFIAHNVWMQVAALPVIAERRTGPGPKDWEQVPHPAVDRLNSPSSDDESDSSSFVGELITSIFNSGEFRVWKLGRNAGKAGGVERDPASLMVIPPHQIIPKRWDLFGKATAWEWTPASTGGNVKVGPITIESRHLLSFKEFKNPWEPNRGIPRAHPAAWSLSGDFYARRHNASLAKNSGRVSGAFHYEQNTPTKTLEWAKREFDDLYGGAENAGAIAHLTAKDFKSMVQNAQEMDWIEGAKLSREEILLLWSVYPETQGFGSTTFANREAAEKAQWENFLIPLATRAVCRPFMRLYQMDPERERLRFQTEHVPALRPNELKEAQTEERRARSFLNLVQGGASVESAAQATGFDLEAAPPTGSADPIVQELRDAIERGELLRLDILEAVDGRIADGLRAVQDQLEATRRSIPVQLPPGESDPDGPDGDPPPVLLDAPQESIALRAVIWKNLDNQAREHERRVRGAFSRFLNEQRIRILQAVDSLSPEGAAALRFDSGEKGADPSPGDLATARSLFDLDAENAALEEALGPVLEEIVIESGRRMEIELDGMGLEGDADVPLPGAQAEARRNLDRINETTLRSLAVAVRDSQEDPEAPADKGVADTIARIGQAVRGVFNKAKNARAKLVGQTGAGRAMNAARHEVTVIRQVQLNEWITQRDAKVRDSHKNLDGATAAPGQTFKAGVSLRYPHDPDAPIEETANCRCYLLAKAVEYEVEE